MTRHGVGLAARLGAAGGGLLLVGALAVGGPAVAPAGGQIVSLPTFPSSSSTSTPNTTTFQTTLPPTTAPAPTITVATVPTTRPPRTTTSTDASEDTSTTSSTGVPTTPPPITTTLPPLPDTTPVTAPIDLSIAGHPSYPWTQLMVTLLAFGIAIGILAAPVVAYRLRHRRPGDLRATLSAGTAVTSEVEPILAVPVDGSRRGRLPRGARRAGAPPGPDAGRTLTPRRPARRRRPAAGGSAPDPTATAPPAPARPTKKAPVPPVPPVPPSAPVPPGATPGKAAKPAKPPRQAKQAKPKVPRPPRPVRPAPPPVEPSPWAEIEGRVPSDDPLAERPEDRTPRPPRRKRNPDS